MTFADLANAESMIEFFHQALEVFNLKKNFCKAGGGVMTAARWFPTRSPTHRLLLRPL